MKKIWKIKELYYSLLILLITNQAFASRLEEAAQRGQNIVISVGQITAVIGIILGGIAMSIGMANFWKNGPYERAYWFCCDIWWPDVHRLNEGDFPMKIRKTSRVLNDESFFMGLSYNDIVGVGVFLLILLFFGQIFNVESPIWAISISLFVLISLIPIRINYRRKILRDSLKYISKNGVIDVHKSD